MPKELPVYESPEKFFFETPLYELQLIDEDRVKHLFGPRFKIEGYCYYCKKMRTFERDGDSRWGDHIWKQYIHASTWRLAEPQLECTHGEHRLRFYLSLRAGIIQKIGQLPSFADI